MIRLLGMLAPKYNILHQDQASSAYSSHHSTPSSPSPYRYAKQNLSLIEISSKTPRPATLRSLLHPPLQQPSNDPAQIIHQPKPNHPSTVSPPRRLHFHPLPLPLPLLRRKTLGGPRMNRSDLLLQRPIHQSVSCKGGLLLELGGHDRGLEGLATASCFTEYGINEGRDIGGGVAK